MPLDGMRASEKAPDSDRLCRAQVTMTSDEETAYLRPGGFWRYNHVEECNAMKTITIELPDDATLPFGGSDELFARELRLAAAIFWYDRGLISQGKGAEIAGLSRVEFIDALGRANVSAIQTTVEELRAELEQPRDARR
jgi:predicted HTH domain antitoxin